MPKQSDYNQIGISTDGDSPVTLRDFNFSDPGLLMQAFNKIDERSDKALETMSAIDASLANVQLDSSEDKWKADYANGIKKQINDAAKYGDYSRALDVATKLAGDSLSNPALQGRMRAHQSRQKALEQVNSRNDINQDTKTAWNLANKYHYEDKYDENGNIIGGEDWTADWTPVSDIDLQAEIAKYVSLIAPEKGSASNSSQSGVTNPDGTGHSGGSSSSRSFQKLDYKRIAAQINNMISNNPQLKAAYAQQYRVYQTLADDAERRMKYAKTEKERKNAEMDYNRAMGNMTDYDGIVTNDYAKVWLKRNGVYAKNFAYEWIETSHSSSSTKDNQTSAAKNAGLVSDDNNKGNKGNNNIPTYPGLPMGQ